ncbi:Homeobox-like_domain superfamily [Hexamita inflata]|uniref:Homeobox-like_domain superfamily n=1 Tax=Hexamita inflata TaxID=28002 RepID=A0ABP1KCS3_9EUKA
MNMKIKNKLVENIALTQEIHALNHMVLNVQFSCAEQTRKHWTRSEDMLLNQATLLFGINNLNRLQKILISKNRKQIYFRIRYINENPNMFQNQTLYQLMQLK